MKTDLTFKILSVYIYFFFLICHKAVLTAAMQWDLILSIQKPSSSFSVPYRPNNSFSWFNVYGLTRPRIWTNSLLGFRAGGSLSSTRTGSSIGAVITGPVILAARFLGGSSEVGAWIRGAFFFVGVLSAKQIFIFSCL